MVRVEEELAMYVVHLNYGTCGRKWEPATLSYRNITVHLVRRPDGSGKLIPDYQLKSYLTGKQWRYAQ